MTRFPDVTRRSLLGCVGAMACTAAVPVRAQADFPSRPLRIVLGLPAGGAADVVVRALAEEMAQSMKQPVIVENRPGGLFVPAVQAVATAPADGYTLLYVNASFVTVQVAQKRFDLLRQFEPVALTGEAPSVLLVSAGSRFKTLKDLVEHGRSHPGELTYGTLGVGTLEHLKSVQFAEAAGFQARAIPYKGGPDMINAVIAGDLGFTGVNVFSAQPLIASGRVRALAALDTTRIPSLPEVPTVGEAGVKVSSTRIWSGFMVPTGTPAPVVQRLFTELVTAMKSPSIARKFSPLGVMTTTSKSPDEFRSLIASEADWMGAIARKLDLTNQ